MPEPPSQNTRADRAKAHSPPDGMYEIQGLRKAHKIEPDQTVEVVLEIESKQKPQAISSKPVIIEDDQEEEILYQPSKQDKIIQRMLDELQQAFKLDPTGENYSVVVAVTQDNGKIFTIKADSTDSAKYKDVEVLGRPYVEAEVTKTLTAFENKEQDRQRHKLLLRKSPV